MMLKRTGIPLIPAALLLCSLTVSACRPLVHVATQLENPVTPDDGFTADFQVSCGTIDISITNTNNKPIEVLWQKASIVDPDGNSWPVMHGGGRSTWSAKDFTDDDVTRIPPHSTLSDWIAPRQNVRFDDGWYIRPFIRVECGAAHCPGYESLVGKTIRLNMTLWVLGEERDFDWTFRITKAVESVRGARPTDPDLSTERPRVVGDATIHVE